MSKVGLFFCFFMLVLSYDCSAQTSLDRPLGVGDSSIELMNESNEKKDENKIDSSLWDKRTISVETWSKVKNDKAFIYKNPTKQKVKNQKPLNLKWLNIFFIMLKWIAIFCVIALVSFVIYMVAKDGNFTYFKLKNKSQPVIDVASIEEVETFTAWDKALQDALQKEDYRLATRVLYLELLQKMNQKGLVKYGANLTNWDYVGQLLQSNYLYDFTRLTNYFDRVWYGSTSLSFAQFNVVKQAFFHFKQSIN
jgi:hypothetical protein